VKDEPDGQSLTLVGYGLPLVGVTTIVDPVHAEPDVVPAAGGGVTQDAV
jgi:hypothetical protein